MKTMTLLLLSVLTILTTHSLAASVKAGRRGYGIGAYNIPSASSSVHSTNVVSPRVIPQMQFSRWQTCSKSTAPISMAFVLDDYGLLYTCGATQPLASTDYATVRTITISKETPCNDFLFVITNLYYSGGAAVVFSSGSHTYFAGGINAPEPVPESFPHSHYIKTAAYARWMGNDCYGFEDNYSEDELVVLATDLISTNAFKHLQGYFGYPFTSAIAQQPGQNTLCVLVKNPTCV